jgi:hypothetical protein
MEMPQSTGPLAKAVGGKQVERTSIDRWVEGKGCGSEVGRANPSRQHCVAPSSRRPANGCYGERNRVRDGRSSRARRTAIRGSIAGMLAVLLLGGTGCGVRTVRTMEVTGYCSCGDCTGWERGNWRYLKLDFWNRYVKAGPQKGRPYSGLTASGTKPRQPHPGLFSVNSLTHPWMIPVRLLLPWLWLAHDGTIAADTRYYSFGTRIFVPGYGYGVVEDRGSAIKGPERLDLYFDSHRNALRWGRRKVDVRIE